MVEEAWSDIDVLLKRRYDLIPNLIETVKAYAKHEKNLFEDLTKARSEAISSDTLADKGTADKNVTLGIKNILAWAENYPKLMASQNFLELQKNLTETEDVIAKARKYYNGTVREFNIKIQSFPDWIIAKISGYKAKEFFQYDENL